MVQHILEVAGIIVIAIGVVLHVIPSEQPEAQAEIRENVSVVYQDGNSCSQGGLLPASVQKCETE
jgi:hypothetical protein